MDTYNDMIKGLPESIKEDFVTNEKLVEENMKYLKDLGIKKYIEIFNNYYPMFLMDNSKFMSIFNKYDKSDLLDKISKNITIIEHL